MIDETFSFFDLGLCAQLVDATKQIGWKHPTMIQKETIPLALKRMDVCGMAVTGSGKTGAYVLPLLHHLLEVKKRLFALILSPRRELSAQIADVCRTLGSSIHVSVCAITGGVDETMQLKVLKEKPHIISATPGRFAQLLRENPKLDFTPIRFLVFDEADQMLPDVIR
jgi:ATP-dependent RNA helicase DDX47/RRP3